ncbi:class I SAM-dependent methyltransferase [Kutzneria sp. NPDC052558]|uniref:class I SAM-dependent methyltransferase n=1 Tax=Kutzneria sp. NPDC052558 TaxID=3364121 RepID=UPI0037CAD6D7
MTVEQLRTEVPADVNGVVEQLVLATFRDRDLRAALADIGPERVAGLLVDELVFRAPRPLNDEEIVVRLDLTHEGSVSSFELTATAKVGLLSQPWQGREQHAAIGFELADFARALFGPAHAPLGRLHSTELRYSPKSLGPGAEREPAKAMATFKSTMHQISQALQTLNQAWSAPRAGLDELMLRYGSDKCGVHHWFTPHYERHIGHLRDQPVRFLEIGIGGYNNAAGGGQGGSLRAWKHYFSRGIVFGMDIFDKSELDEPRLVTVKADQNDPEQLREIVERYGPFDVIVDDGSHVNQHIHTSLRELFPHLRPGGVYVVEDLWTSFCPGYGGDDADVNSAATSIGLLKTITDALHHEERAHVPAAVPRTLEEQAVGLHVYHNIAFIDKGVNAEGGIPEWIPRSPRPSS